jgi:hypothetical protein
MTGEAADGELVDIVELLAQSGLTVVDQRRVHNALVNNMIEGWTPDCQAVVVRLIDFVAGRIDAAAHTRQVLHAQGL